MPSKTLIYIIFLIATSVKAQGETDIYHIPPPPPSIGDSVSFETTISIDIEVVQAIFLYRVFGQHSYQEKEMEESIAGSWIATISKVPDGDGIEYFFMLSILSYYLY